MKIFSILFFLILISCISGKIVDQTGIEEIKFGTGGGFTNELKSYTLTAGYALFENEKELKKIEAKKIQEIFRQAQELNDYLLMEPGNMYSFIEIKSKEKTNRILWAYGSIKVDKKVDDFHKRLMAITK